LGEIGQREADRSSYADLEIVRKGIFFIRGALRNGFMPPFRIRGRLRRRGREKSGTENDS